MIEQAGLYQNKVNSASFPTVNVKWAIERFNSRGQHANLLEQKKTFA